MGTIAGLVESDHRLRLELSVLSRSLGCGRIGSERLGIAEFVWKQSFVFGRFFLVLIAARVSTLIRENVLHPITSDLLSSRHSPSYPVPEGVVTDHENFLGTSDNRG
jgi:hypothetical protein